MYIVCTATAHVERRKRERKFKQAHVAFFFIERRPLPRPVHLAQEGKKARSLGIGQGCKREEFESGI